jgi:hypothetical protein
MKKIRLPSPAMIVALLALCVALGGSAYAASKINGKNIRNGTISGKKLKNRTITSSKISRATVRALKDRRGLRGPRGFRGRTGAKGATGPSGTALAYARVAADGTVDASRAKGIAQANVTHTSGGPYCFVNLGFTPKNVLATLEPLTNGDVYAQTDAALGCPAGAATVQVQVSGAGSNGAFYVAFN